MSLVLIGLPMLSFITGADCGRGLFTRFGRLVVDDDDVKHGNVRNCFCEIKRRRRRR